MNSERPPRDPILREAMTKAPEPVLRPFVHLRVHSAYSLLEGALPLKKIIGKAVADAAPAIAITDTNNLFGALEFSQYAVKDGLQPIIGCQLDVAFNDSDPDRGRGLQKRQGGSDLFPVIFIAATENGYANLVRLVSRSYLDNAPGDPVQATLEWVEELSEGIICLTGGPRGPIGAALKTDHMQLAERRLLQLKRIFGDRLYVELERVEGYDRIVEAKTIDLAYAHELPLVATNEAFFPARDDYEAHDALIAIAEGSVIAADDRRRLAADNYLKSQAEMSALFADLPEARSRSRAAAPTSRRIASRSCRALPAAMSPTPTRWRRRKPPSSGGRRRRDWRRGSRPTARRPASRQRTTGSGWNTSSASSSG
jgi:DNA polymerase-3 subunit alpha